MNYSTSAEEHANKVAQFKANVRELHLEGCIDRRTFLNANALLSNPNFNNLSRKLLVDLLHNNLKKPL